MRTTPSFHGRLAKGSYCLKLGAPGRNRTCFLSVRSRTLCPVSYRRGKRFAVYSAPSVYRLLAIIALSASLAACQSGAHPVVSPSPVPTPHTSPAAAILQSAEVPTGLNACPGSGPIDAYIAGLAGADAPLAARVSTQWEQLRAAGATGGAISVFASSPAACNAELGAVSNIKSITSFVAVFGDSGQANRAWGSGVFGFAPPASGEILAGVTRGSATGLGTSSWTYDRAPLKLACWHKSVFVAFVVVGNHDATAFNAATAAVDARLT